MGKSKSNLQKIVVTGGHLTPAISVITQLKKLNPQIEFCFFGRKQSVEGDKAFSFEYLEIKKARIPFFEIPAGRLQRKLTRYSLVSLVKILPGFIKSLILLRKIRPNLVLTFGGYLALPVALAAKVLRILVVAHEQTPHLGLANQLIFKFAKLKGVSSYSLAEKLRDEKVIFTGPLLRSEIFQTEPESSQLAKFLGNVGNSKLIYFTGGATGSHFLNKITEFLMSKILKENFVIHQTGNLRQSLDFKKLSKLKKMMSKNLSKKYFLTEFVQTCDVGAILKRANLVICRSGANTTSELAAFGKVAIIIPLEWGAEQKQIAADFEKTGAGIVIQQSGASKDGVLKAIQTIFSNFAKFEKNAKILQENTPTQGATLFSKKILALNA